MIEVNATAAFLNLIPETPGRPLLALDDFRPQDGLKVHSDGYDDSDGTTACPIALGIIALNNAKGYSVAKLETRLLPGHLMPASGGADYRVLNRVLFAVLAEISCIP